VIVISSDFEELAICERVAVIREGTIVEMVQAEHATKEHLTSLCYAVEEKIDE
jgi:ribose transport system ATP-binding protein